MAVVGIAKSSKNNVPFSSPTDVPEQAGNVSSWFVCVCVFFSPIYQKIFFITGNDILKSDINIHEGLQAFVGYF